MQRGTESKAQQGVLDLHGIQMENNQTQKWVEAFQTQQGVPRGGGNKQRQKQPRKENIFIISNIDSSMRKQPFLAREGRGGNQSPQKM